MTEPRPSKPLTAAATIKHLDALPIGTRLGEFEITGLLGVGGFGMVYQALDHSLQREVAIKEYMPAYLARRSQGAAVSVRSSADGQTFAEGLKSFMSEARLLAQFDHPSLVKVFRFWEENNTAYMVMPLYRGITLKHARAQMRCPPPEEWLRKMLWSMLGALKVLHNASTMHRDISPENIFLQDVGPPVLLDLGAARRAIHGTHQQLTATLKYSYAPIEQYGEAPGLRQGPWTDLYSLAAVVYGCVAVELPLPATLRVVRDRQPSFASAAQRAHGEFGLNYSSGFVSSIDQALAVRPGGRPKSVNSFARLMDLQTPAGMSKFDWRAELGDIYVQPLVPADPEAVNQATTVVFQAEATVPASAATAATPEATAALFSGDEERKTLPLWLLAAGVAVAALLAVLLWPTYEAPLPAAVPALVAPSVEAVTAAPEPAASAATTAPMPRLEVAAPAPPAAPPAHRKVLPKAAPASTLAASSAQALPTPAASTPALAAEKSAAAAREAVAGAKAATPAAATPQSLCADRNFFARPMCFFDECQKPEFAKLPMCVENAKRLQESRNQRER